MKWEQRGFIVLSEVNKMPLCHGFKLTKWEAEDRLQEAKKILPSYLSEELKVVSATLHYEICREPRWREITATEAQDLIEGGGEGMSPEKSKLLQEWLDTFNKIEAVYGDLSRLFGATPEAAVTDVIYNTFQKYTRLLSNELGDDGSFWMDWFLWENKGGLNGSEAGYDKDIRKIRTLKDLEWLIDTGNDRKKANQ